MCVCPFILIKPFMMLLPGKYVLPHDGSGSEREKWKNISLKYFLWFKNFSPFLCFPRVFHKCFKFTSFWLVFNNFSSRAFSGARSHMWLRVKFYLLKPHHKQKAIYRKNLLQTFSSSFYFFISWESFHYQTKKVQQRKERECLIK